MKSFGGAVIIASILARSDRVDEDAGCLIALPKHSDYKPGTIVDGNCVFDYELGLPVDRPHCPEATPIALVLTPKAASTSFLNWLVAVDGTAEYWAELAELFESRVNGECINYAPGQGCDLSLEEAKARTIELIFKVTQGIPPRGTSGKSARASFWTPEGQAEIHFRFGRRFHAGLLALPQNCIPCCRAFNGRIPVAVARNPFSRLMAYFQRAWLGINDNFNTIDGFALWIEGLRAVADHGLFSNWPQDISGRECTDVNSNGRVNCTTAGAVNVEVNAQRLSFTFEDLYHTRPVHKMLAEQWPADLYHDLEVVLPACSPEACWFARRIFMVRIERAAEDLDLLWLRLCVELNRCESLPTLAHLNAQSSPNVENIRTFWGSSSGAKVAQWISSDWRADFALGHYDVDPMKQTPQQPSVEAVQSWLYGRNNGVR